MVRNVITGLPKVDWSDGTHQNEFVNSLVSALSALGEALDYDTVCAVSGSAFRTSFSVEGWNHGNYHVVHTPIIIEHTFKMLGYHITQHVRGRYQDDKSLIINSIDRGVPVITLEGVVNCSDACVIAGYDQDGDVLLGYSPFMNIPDDHNEPHDETGYFQKSNWHDGYAAQGRQLRIITIDGKADQPAPDEVLRATLKLAVQLIETPLLVEGQHNGLAAHQAFADALMTREWQDGFEPYLNVMCNYKQYLDRHYAAEYLHLNGRDDLASYYDKIAGLCEVMGQIIPQDFSALDVFSDQAKLRPYTDLLKRIGELESQFVKRVKETL
ncbi:MAG: cysteine peptidase family C39 domain-containing protein [Armatimonadota bacterium]